MSDAFGSAMPGDNETREFSAQGESRVNGETSVNRKTGENENRANGASSENDASENASFDSEMNAAAAGNAATKLSGGERRSRRRALISAPVRVRSLDVTGCNVDEVSTTLDVSRGGVLFVSSRRAFAKGMEVAVTFPYSKSPVAVQAEQMGRIVRVTAMPDGRQSVGVALGCRAEAELVDAAGHKLSVDVPRLHDRIANSVKPLVLIVDADSTVRTSLKAALSCDGYDVVAVSSAAEALEVLKMYTPALVIAEIEGEDLPGFELCAHVKSTPRLQAIPVMLMTSSAYPSDYSNAHSLGAVVCMAKPFKQERLRHVVRLLAPTAQAKAQTAPARTADETRRHCNGKQYKVVQPASDSVKFRPRKNW